jgi:3-oxoacyl-[acyl-carrier protein] reductase
MNDVIFIVGGGSGIGLEVAKLALECSVNPVVAVDFHFNSDFSALELRSARRLQRISARVDKNLDWLEILSEVISIRSMIFVIPPCKSRDSRINDIGFSDDFCENVSSINKALLDLISTARLRLAESSSLVLISSVLSKRVAVADASLDYHAAKAVLEAIMRYLAVKLAPKTNVNCVAPGLIARSNESVLLVDDRTRCRIKRSVPQERPSSQSEVAKTVWALCSGSLPYVSGQTIVMDGASSVLEPFSISR